MEGHVFAILQYSASIMFTYLLLSEDTSPT